MARLNLDHAAIEKYKTSFARKQVRDTITVMGDVAQARIPKKTGATSRRFYKKTSATPDGVTGEVGYRTIVALWLDRGTKPHIEPRSGWGRMTFYWEKKGKWVTLYHVNHPGIKGSRFLTDTLYIAKARGFRIDINQNPLP